MTEEEPSPSSAPIAPVEPILFNVEDACRILGNISTPLVYKLIGTGKLRPTKIGSRSLFTMDELWRFVKECQTNPPDEAEAG